MTAPQHETTGSAEQGLRSALTPVYGDREALLIADRVLEHITGLARLDRLTNKDRVLSQAQESQLATYRDRLLKSEPVQYVLDEAWFAGMKLYVDAHVLIPRPETEELVNWVVEDVRSSGKDVFGVKDKAADKTTELKILDVGTGSGCIALALKKIMPRAEVWGCDVSEEALVVARRNSSTLDIRVDFQGLDFRDGAQQKQLPTVDVVVSNPPYIPLSEHSEMHANVVAFEPHLALFVANEDPLEFYRVLATFGKHRLYEEGRMYVETHENLATAVAELFRQAGYRDIEIRKDMQGKDRMVRAAI
jgi:release factor glutamine methyltransferase